MATKTKKRSNGEGHIKRKGNGVWSGQIMDGYRDDGKKNIVTFTGYTKNEVMDKIRDYKNNRDRGVKIDKTLTFNEWADLWYADYRTEVQPSTYSGYKYTLKTLEDHFGKMPLADILPIHINQFLDSLLSKNLSVSLIRKCRAMLIQIFDAADNNGLVNRNPARHAKKNKIKLKEEAAKMSKKDAFTGDEVNALTSGLPDNLIGNSIRVELGTGLRTQELLALHRDDIAEDGSLIRVHAAIKMVDGQPVIGPPKSETSKRTIPVPVTYRPYVLRMLELGGDDLIWVKQGKTPYYSVGTYRRQYYAALSTLPQVRKLPPHCCRHTYVTMLQAKGVPLETIAALVGHANVEVTDDYLHIAEATLSDAVSVLDTHVNRKTEQL